MIRLSLVLLTSSLLAGCAVSSRDAAELNAIMMQSSSNFSAQASQNLANSSNYRIPQSQPYYGGSNTIRCNTIGSFVSCR